MDDDAITTPRRVKRAALSSDDDDDDDVVDDDGEDLEEADTTPPRRVKRASVGAEEYMDDGEEDEEDDEDEGGGATGTSGGEDGGGTGAEDDGDGGDGDDGTDAGRESVASISAASVSDAGAAIAAGLGSTGSGASIQPALYHSDIRVYALDKGELYEATVLRSRLRTRPDPSTGGTVHRWSYYVHYLGWSSRWDKWLDESDLRDDTAEIREEAERVKERTREAERTRKEKARERRERKARAREARREAKAKRRRERDGPTLEECCALPFTLRTLMVDDRERIVRMGGRVASGYDNVSSRVAAPDWRPPRMVHTLPAAATVRAVLLHYVKRRRRDLLKTAAGGGGGVEVEDGRMGEREVAEERAASVSGFADDLCRIFDRALPVLLLYRQERTQYLAMRRDPRLGMARNCEVYGCEHLLRLFVRLPGVIAGKGAAAFALSADVPGAASFRRDVTDLIVFLQRYRATCFRARYREPTEEEWTEAERAIVVRCSSAGGGGGGLLGA